METTYFGLGFDFEGGADPGVAIHTGGVVVEVHKSATFAALYARVGTLDEAQIDWNDAGDSYTDGVQPAVAMNSRGDVVDVHKSEWRDKLFTIYGSVSGTAIGWSDDSVDYSDGHDPAVAVNYNRQVVTVYVDDDKLKYRRGTINTSGKKVEFDDAYDLGTGEYPKVAMNDNGWVVAVWQQKVDGVWALRCKTGKLSTDVKKIDWGSEHSIGDLWGERPCVALTNDGFVVAIYSAGTSMNLMQIIGRLETGSKTVTWGELLYFDDGKHSSVAAAGKTAVRIAQGADTTGLYNRLWYSTSLITDRSSWMQDRLSRLGAKKMKQLFLPGSHDAGMYTGGFSTLGKTQQLSIRGQLEAGQRYFDLRVEWNDPVFHIHHGGINGPLLTDVLYQINDFCLNGHKELVILCFSHFEHFGDDGTIYERFVNEVNTAIGPWLYKTKPEGRRLADITLSEYISNSMSILVVVDEDWAIDYPEPGFWVFRNSASAAAAEGDLRVFDQYASDANYEDVKKDQEEKFASYNGYCDPAITVPCDLFLFSWTCTSPVGAGVWQVSKNINRHLGVEMATLGMPNRFGLYPNIIYVDYCEFARTTDVVLYVNDTPLPATARLDIRKSGAKEEAQPPMYDISTFPGEASPERSSE
jgi:hypothetical protein